MWAWSIILVAQLAIVVAQCPSGPLGLSTTINGQTYFFKVRPTIAPGTKGPFANPGDLVTDGSSATAFNLLSNGTVVDVVTNGDLVYAFEAGYFSFEQPSAYYYMYNSGYTFLVTLSCSPDSIATFTAYALPPPYTGPPTKPQTASTFYACPYGDGGALQLTTTGTAAAPAAAPIGPTCILLSSIRVFSIQEQAPISPNSITTIPAVTTAQDADMANGQSTSSPQTSQTVGTESEAQTPVILNTAAAPDLFPTSTLRYLNTTTTHVIAATQIVTQANKEPTTTLQAGNTDIKAQNSYTAVQTTIVGPAVVYIVVQAASGTQNVIIGGQSVAVTSTILSVPSGQSVTTTILSPVPSILVPAVATAVCQCDYQSVVVTAIYTAIAISSLNLGTTMYIATAQTSTLGVVTILNGRISPATPTITYTGSVVENTKIPLSPGQHYQTISVPINGLGVTTEVVVIVSVQVVEASVTKTASQAIDSGIVTRKTSTLLTMSAIAGTSQSSEDTTSSYNAYGNSTSSLT